MSEWGNLSHSFCKSGYIMKKLFFSLLVLLVINGIVFLAYPTVSNTINEYTNKSKINEYNKNVYSVSPDEIEKLLSKAEQYNNALTVDCNENFSKDEYKNIFENYENILNFGSGLICYIEIPSININLPVYHSSENDNSVLSRGAVHLKQTSFPIGGKSTHCVISAHSGYPSQKFFDDIDKLGNGDYFYINILNQRLKYEVFSTQVIEPDETDSLRIVEEKDIVTLVTCYPYGINTQRLLVAGQRVYDGDNPNAENEKEISDNNGSKNYFLSIFIAILIIVLLIIILLLIKKRKKKNEKR